MRMISARRASLAFASALDLLLRASALAQTETPSQPVRGLDPNAPAMPKTIVGRYLTFGGRLEVESGFATNLDFDSTRSDDFYAVVGKILLALSFDPNEHVQLFLGPGLTEDLEARSGKITNQVSLGLGLAFLNLKNIANGFSLQIGRLRFLDQRRWLFDRNLDGAKLSYQKAELTLELSGGRQGYVNIDLLKPRRDEAVDTYLFSARYAFSPKLKLTTYFLAREDQAGSNSPIFTGLQAAGAIKSGFDYWLDLAEVIGHDNGKKIRGTGFDVGTAYQFWDLPLEPCVMFSVAYGSGDSNPHDSTDRNFRQTGLQENAGNLGGLPYLKYYGELFAPELSNLSVFTSAVSFKARKESSIALLYHYYLQNEASPIIRNSRIDANPTGLDTGLGSELDLVVSYEEIHNVELGCKVGYFIPGSAFGGKMNNAVSVTLSFGFHF